MKGLDHQATPSPKASKPLSATAQEQFSKPKDIPTLIKE
jgi:hypothetical protein